MRFGVAGKGWAERKEERRWVLLGVVVVAGGGESGCWSSRVQ